MDHSVLDLVAFRAAFPAFADTTAFPDAMLNLYYSQACLFIDENDNYCGLNGTALDFALQQLTAHLLYCADLIAQGQEAVIVTATTVDKISLTLEAPPATTGWQYWLSTSPYGKQLWAFLMVQAAGGWTVGGLPERRAFRKTYGMF